jgi:subtilase family serine protease
MRNARLAARTSPRHTLRPRSRARLQVEQLEARTVPSSVVYTPAQIRTGYGFDSIPLLSGKAVDGTGQTIAIVDAYNDSRILSDANTFNRAFGLPVLTKGTTFKQVNQAGGTTLPRGNAGWGEEMSLDVEWAHAIAPGANILLVEANSNSYSDLLTAVSYAGSHANVVSMSWGGGEFSNEASLDSTYFQQTGVTYVASAGDSGAAAEWPASSADVVSVGGTTLNLTSVGTYFSETAWSSSGGGTSALEPEPSYQVNAGITGGKRTVPDVAYNADPNTGVYVYDSYGVYPGLYAFGGTSAGAPQWAGLVALADQARGSTGVGSTKSLTGSTQVLPTLYSQLANPTTYSNTFNDITSGSNGNPATKGYDQVTGLGTPQARAVIAALAATTLSPNISGSGSSSPTGSSGSGSGHRHSAVPAPVVSAPTGLTATPSPVVTATLTSGTTALLTQPQFSVSTLPGTAAVGNSTQATTPALFVVGTPAARSVLIVGAEDPVTYSTEVGTGRTVAPAGPAAVRPGRPGAAILSPGLGQGVGMGVGGITDNGPMMPEESEEAAALDDGGLTAGPASAFAGLALALGGSWGLPREESAEQRRIRARAKVWPKG